MKAVRVAFETFLWPNWRNSNVGKRRLRKRGAAKGSYGFRVIKPAAGAVAQVLVSGTSTSILACGDGARDENGDLGTVYAYCYQSLSSIPANAPAGAPSVTASGASAAWQIDDVPGATCGPSLPKKQKNYLAIWVTYPSTPQITTQPTFYGVCNGLTTDECGSGSYGGCGCVVPVDLPAVPTELRARIFGKSGMFAELPEELEFSWKPALRALDGTMRRDEVRFAAQR